MSLYYKARKGEGEGDRGREKAGGELGLWQVLWISFMHNQCIQHSLYHLLCYHKA